MMKKIKENYLFFITIFLFCIVFMLFSYIFLKKNNIAENNILKIASLSPSITEYIYDVGLDKYLVANTVYCNYPEDAKHKEKIGTFNDINYEQIAKLQINTAIIQPHMNSQKKQLESMGIKVVEINNNTIDDIINAYDILGKEFNINDITDKRKKRIISKIEAVKQKIQFVDKEYTAVVSVFRNYPSISAITAAGKNNLYNDILSILNLKNPFEKYPAYTEISQESLLSVDPDFIFDMYHGNNVENAKENWAGIPLKSVKNDNIIILNDVYLSLPGPRIDMIIDRFAQKYFEKLHD